MDLRVSANHTFPGAISLASLPCSSGEEQSKDWPIGQERITPVSRYPVPRRVGERRWSHKGAAPYVTVRVQRYPQAVTEMVREKPSTLLMLLDMLDPRRYPLAQEVEFNIPANALSCQEMKAALVGKGPQVPVALYPHYRAFCCAHVPPVCLAGTLQTAGVKDNPFRAQLDRGPDE
jgi:hypothetical protein